MNFKDRKLALQQKPKTNLRILPFVTQCQPSVPNLKQILMKNWHLIEKQPLLSEIYKKPALVSYKRGRSLKDILVRAKLRKSYLKHALGSRVGLSTPFYTEWLFPQHFQGRWHPMKFCAFSRQPRSQGSLLPCRKRFGNLSYFEHLFALWAISLARYLQILRYRSSS